MSHQNKAGDYFVKFGRIPLDSVISLHVHGNKNIVAYLLKERTVELEKQPLLGNSRTQQ
jgi:hypothetical protein